MCYVLIKIYIAICTYPTLNFYLDLTNYSKIVELEEELRVVGNNLKSLEVSEEKVRFRFNLHTSSLNTYKLHHLSCYIRISSVYYRI